LHALNGWDEKSVSLLFIHCEAVCGNKAADRGYSGADLTPDGTEFAV